MIEESDRYGEYEEPECELVSEYDMYVDDIMCGL